MNITFLSTNDGKSAQPCTQHRNSEDAVREKDLVKRRRGRNKSSMEGGF